MKKLVKSLLVCGVVLSSLGVSYTVGAQEEVTESTYSEVEVPVETSGLQSALDFLGYIPVGVSDGMIFEDSVNGREFVIRGRYNYEGKDLYAFTGGRDGGSVSPSRGYVRMTLTEALELFSQNPPTNAVEQNVYDSLVKLDMMLDTYNVMISAGNKLGTGSDVYGLVQAFITDNQDPAINYNISDVAEFYSIDKIKNGTDIVSLRGDLDTWRNLYSLDTEFNGAVFQMHSDGVNDVTDFSGAFKTFDSIVYDESKLVLNVGENGLVVDALVKDGSTTTVELSRGTEIGVDRQPTFVYISLEEDVPSLVELQGVTKTVNTVDIVLPGESLPEETTVSETLVETTVSETTASETTVAPVAPSTPSSGGSSSSGGVSSGSVARNIVTEYREETEVIPFQVEVIENPELPSYEEVIKQEGKDGEKVVTYEVSVENSNEIGKRKIAETITVEPVNKIVEVKAKNGVIQETEEEVIPYTSSERENPKIAKGERVVSTGGVDGKVVVTYDVTYQDGRVIDRREVSRVISDPINEVIDVGTADMETRVETRVEPISYSTEIISDTNMYVDEPRKTVQVGIVGSREAKYEVSYTNGTEVGRKLLEQKTLTEPTKEIIHVGVRERNATAEAARNDLPNSGEKSGNILLGVAFVLLVFGVVGAVFGKRR